MIIEKNIKIKNVDEKKNLKKKNRETIKNNN